MITSVKCHGCEAVYLNGIPSHETGCRSSFLFTRGKRQLELFRVWSLDVWGNSREGFEVNDRSELGSVMLPIEATDSDVIKALKRKEWINKYTKHKSFNIDGDYNGLLMVDWRKTGEPMLQLERQ